MKLKIVVAKQRDDKVLLFRTLQGFHKKYVLYMRRNLGVYSNGLVRYKES